MIIGILQCDSVHGEFRDQFENYPGMFQTLLKKIDATLTFNIYDVQHGIYPINRDECDGYIITGSKASVYDDDLWIDTLQKYIVELDAYNKKLIAVCFGHQLVAQAFGGRTEKSDKGWGVGVHTYQIQHTPIWIKTATSSFNILVSHQDQVTKLPGNAEHIAGNEFCPNSLFQLNNNILAMQGHPEFTKNYSETLMKHRKMIIGEDRLNEGITSLRKQTNELIIATWMLHFLSAE